jgi:hypothetical protein
MIDEVGGKMACRADRVARLAIKLPNQYDYIGQVQLDSHCQATSASISCRMMRSILHATTCYSIASPSGSISSQNNLFISRLWRRKSHHD